MMNKIVLLFCLVFILSIPTTSFAWGLEIAGGAWYQKPSGNMSFDNSTPENDLDLEDDLNYDDKWKAFGRLIIDMPLFFPNIYLMYTPMKWDETGSKNVNFNFGGKDFQANVDFNSELKLNHFDVGFFWGLPFINTATADVLNIDLGLNVRIMDVKAEIEQKDLDLKESESYLLPLPMLYTGIQIKPLRYIALEFEGRGIGWSSDYYVSLTGRLKVKPSFLGPVFVAGGYRYDNLKIDYQDIDIDTEFYGPFAEAGLEF
jgi:outer membrane protein